MASTPTEPSTPAFLTVVNELLPRPHTLPPDNDGMNSDRAEWAQRALYAFQEATRTDDEDAVSDLLADLMHWCDRNHTDFVAELMRGRGHYEEETRDDS